MTDEPDGPDGAERAAADPDAKPARMTKAERLEAKAARLREADQRRAEQDAERAGAGRAAVPRALIVTVSVLGALVLVLGTFVAILVPTWLHQRHLNQARADALHAADSYAVDFGSYDYRHLDADFARVAEHLTPAFKKSYSESSSRLKPSIIQFKGSSVATVQGIAVSKISMSSATVIVLLDQTVSSGQLDAPRIDRNRLQMNLVKRDGTWLISKLLTK